MSQLALWGLHHACLLVNRFLFLSLFCLVLFNRWPIATLFGKTQNFRFWWSRFDDKTKYQTIHNIIEIKFLFTRYSHTDFRLIHYFAPQNTRKNNSYFTNKYKDLSKNSFVAVLFFFSLRASKKKGESCVPDINQKLQMKLLIVQCKRHIYKHSHVDISWVATSRSSPFRTPKYNAFWYRFID